MYVLNFTPTGMIPTKDMTPHVPITPAEIIADVKKVLPLGVNMVHLHARDLDTGKPTWKRDLYAEIIGGIRELDTDVVICVSTSGRTFGEFEQRSDCLMLEDDLKPDFASLTLSSVNFNQQASVNSPQMIQDLAACMRDRGIRPELEAFDLGMLNYASYLIKKELVKPPFYANLILGNISCAQADPMHLGLMIRELPDSCHWSVGGIGNAQQTMNLMGILSGGGARVGLEDNIWYDEKRTRLATNYDLVERVVRCADELGKSPWPRAELRKKLGCRTI